MSTPLEYKVQFTRENKAILLIDLLTYFKIPETPFK